MTVKELHAVLGQLLERRPDEADRLVVVETSNGGIPTMHMEKVARAMPGFDWTHGLFILWTENPVVVYRRVTKPLREVAKEHLEKLKASYEKMKFKYIMKAREPEWIDGFLEGFKLFKLAVDDVAAPQVKSPEEVKTT